MDLRKLKTLIDLVSESGVAELEITEGEDHVRIVNRVGSADFYRPYFFRVYNWEHVFDIDTDEEETPAETTPDAAE